MSKIPQSFYALGRRWARSPGARADWSLPALTDELIQQARDAIADAPWLTDEARRAFAQLPECHP